MAFDSRHSNGGDRHAEGKARAPDVPIYSRSPFDRADDFAMLLLRHSSPGAFDHSIFNQFSTIPNEARVPGESGETVGSREPPMHRLSPSATRYFFGDSSIIMVRPSRLGRC